MEITVDLENGPLLYLDVPKGRVTLRDIAASSGLSVSAVSLALHNHRSIPEATRQKVRAAAHKLGYRPDPALAALNHYRRGKKPCVAGVTIAYLTCFKNPLIWKRDIFFRRTYAGAEERAAALGYKLEHFWANDPDGGNARLSTVLDARGIRGLIIAPLPGPEGTLAMPWDRFSAVAIGPSLVHPQLHTARTNHYQVIQLALERLRALGYHRIGFVVDLQVDRRHQKRFEAAFYLDQLEHAKPKERLAPLIENQFTPDRLRSWLIKKKPEVIIHHDDKLLAAIEALGFSVPHDFGFVSLNRLGDPRVSGVEIPPEDIAASAVDRLDLMLRENETGVPERPTSIIIDGMWFAGATAPLRNGR